VRRELARRARGDSAAARVALSGDAVVQRAVAVLRAARGPLDVFSVAGVPQPDAPRSRGSRTRPERGGSGAAGGAAP